MASSCNLGMRSTGLSYAAIATKLNAGGITSETGGKWYDEFVSNVWTMI